MGKIENIRNRQENEAASSRREIRIGAFRTRVTWPASLFTFPFDYNLAGISLTSGGTAKQME